MQLKSDLFEYNQKIECLEEKIKELQNELLVKSIKNKMSEKESEE